MPPHPPGPADAQRLALLATRVGVSDREAFGALFHLMRPPLLRYAAALVRDGPAAHDLVQDVFVMLWEMRERLDPARSVQSLLFQMTRHRALNHLRGVRTRERLRPEPAPEAAAGPEPGATLDAQALARRLGAWLRALPTRQREAIELVRLRGMTHDEAAHVMGVAPRTVNNHLVRGLQRLHARLAALEPDPS